MELMLGFICGLVVGVLIALAVGYFRSRSNSRAAQNAEQGFRDAFASLAADALSANNEQFLTLARQSLSVQTTAGAAELESRKQLIDKSIQQVTERLEMLRELTGKLEATRKQDYGQLGQRLTEALAQVSQLRQTTDELRAALAHPQKRGQWGERMADDILQMAGMIEGVNYTKQQTIADTGRRPDFTFRLPNGVTLNMDVKFPLDNYLKCLDADAPGRREKAMQDFVGDVRGQVRSIASKAYIDPATGTADFALMFIPNEQVFAFIQELDHTLLAEAMQRRVLFVGPLSLLAVLAIARQAAEAANLARQVGDALVQIGDFTRQWANFKREMDKLGDQLDRAVKQYQTLITTRATALERPLNKLEQLRGNSDEANGQPEEHPPIDIENT
ncbi:MAG: DNA recombination protein RmuC [Planctomycetes bacterium]|nr:DNA recombination protein RmuC [Planctomycetota bacterium]